MDWLSTTDPVWHWAPASLRFLSLGIASEMQPARPLSAYLLSGRMVNEFLFHVFSVSIMTHPRLLLPPDDPDGLHISLSPRWIC